MIVITINISKIKMQKLSLPNLKVRRYIVSGNLSYTVFVLINREQRKVLDK